MGSFQRGFKTKYISRANVYHSFALDYFWKGYLHNANNYFSPGRHNLMVFMVFTQGCLDHLKNVVNGTEIISYE